MSAPVHGFTLDPLRWHPHVRPIDPANASAEQLAALEVTPSNTKVSDYLLVLAHDPESLARRTPLYNAIMYGQGGRPDPIRKPAPLPAPIVTAWSNWPPHTPEASTLLHT